MPARKHSRETTNQTKLRSRSVSRPQADKAIERHDRPWRGSPGGPSLTRRSTTAAVTNSTIPRPTVGQNICSWAEPPFERSRPSEPMTVPPTWPRMIIKPIKPLAPATWCAGTRRCQRNQEQHVEARADRDVGLAPAPAGRGVVGDRTQCWLDDDRHQDAGCDRDPECAAERTLANELLESLWQDRRVQAGPDRGQAKPVNREVDQLAERQGARWPGAWDGRSQPLGPRDLIDGIPGGSHRNGDGYGRHHEPTAKGKVSKPMRYLRAAIAPAVISSVMTVGVAIAPAAADRLEFRRTLPA